MVTRVACERAQVARPRAAWAVNLTSGTDAIHLTSATANAPHQQFNNEMVVQTAEGRRCGQTASGGS